MQEVFGLLPLLIKMSLFILQSSGGSFDLQVEQSDNHSSFESTLNDCQ